MLYWSHSRYETRAVSDENEGGGKLHTLKASTVSIFPPLHAMSVDAGARDLGPETNKTSRDDSQRWMAMFVIGR